MSILSQDAVVNALPGQIWYYYKNPLAGAFVAGDWISLFTAGGVPIAGTEPVSLTATVPGFGTAGSITYVNEGGFGLTYLARASMTSSVQGTFVLYDRLVHAGGINLATTSANTFTSFSVTRPNTTGTSTELWLTITTANTTTAPVFTLSYTNSAGTSGRTTATMTMPRAALPIGWMWPIGLGNGDAGVNAVASLTCSVAGTAGVASLVLMRRLCEIPLQLPNISQSLDYVQMNMPQIQLSPSPGCLVGMVQISNGTAAPTLQGNGNIING